MSLPKIPDISPTITVNREQSINLLLASIAMEEMALAHILNAEGEKLQAFIERGDGEGNEAYRAGLLTINRSVDQMLRSVIKQELLLQMKLEDILELGRTEAVCWDDCEWEKE